MLHIGSRGLGNAITAAEMVQPNLQREAARNPHQALASGNNGDVIGDGFNSGRGRDGAVEERLVGDDAVGIVETGLKISWTTASPVRIAGDADEVDKGGGGGFKCGSLFDAEVIHGVNQCGGIAGEVVEAVETRGEGVERYVILWRERLQKFQDLFAGVRLIG